jgi:hypothetical protein
MIKVNSISGGKTSAFMAAHFPADYDVFSLVRTSDQNCRYPDEKLRRIVEDRLQMDFVGTLEDDKIIHTMLDLEQYIGRPITWVSGATYDEIISNKGDRLPNIMERYCTTHLKIEPIFHWWYKTIRAPFEMRLGFRANEVSRMERTMGKTNSNGLLEIKATVKKHPDGRNKWQMFEWQKPKFPLITERPTFKDEIVEYWKGKPVTFADMNNCVGCFHRNPILLRKMFEIHPNKMHWFASKETKGTWRKDISHTDIGKMQLQIEIDFDEWDEGCESGHCGL